jgi:hypothetical protein
MILGKGALLIGNDKGHRLGRREDGAQSLFTALERLFHGLPAHQVDAEGDDHQHQQEKGQSCLEDKGAVLLVKGQRSIDNGRPRRQLLRGDGKALHGAKIKEQPVGTLLDHGNGGRRNSRKHTQHELCRLFPLGFAGGKHAAEDAAVEMKIPDAVNWNPAMGGEQFRAALKREDLPGLVPGEAEQEHGAVVRQLSAALLHLLHGLGFEELELYPLLVAGHEVLQEFAVGGGGDGVVVNDHQLLQPWLYMQGGIKGVLEAEGLDHPGDPGVSAKHFLFKVVNPAEDHRRFREQFLVVLQQQGEGEVIADDDGVEAAFAVFVAEELEKVGLVDLVVDALGVEILIKELSFDRCPGEMRFDPPADAVGPAEPLVIGVENEEITGLRRSRVGGENRRE